MAARRLPRLAGLVLAVGIGLGLAAACGGAAEQSGAGPMMSKGDGGGSGGAPAAIPAPNQATSGGTSPSDGKQQQPAQQQQVGQPGVDRKLVRTATLELAADNVVEVANKARTIATDLDGFAGQEEVKGDAATITLHIPSNAFDEALGRLSTLVPAENVLSRSQTAEDVTEQLVDLDSRIATQRASVDRVNALLARAASVSEIVQIESEVTRRVADLESLQKRREALSGQVALSKVTVRVSKGDAPPPAAEDDDGGFLAGLVGGWHAFLAAGGFLLRVIGALLPFAIVLGIPAAFALRAWLRRRKPASVAPAQS
ncbi:MAG TPA: DUF4349 domain-containing protein [Actinophytocola sp.]|uniref:DUF4349 domain-containing protein n=1 Tax=Actinophytocola sp. TaxID=1872138 RepID=UPI002DDD8ABC|nr:DUF4349 domain-containing protein [Actinophytocola sp.]HEV2779191.1 DUF4349 domain-containing protein [Actinophytocola sp.]